VKDETKLKKYFKDKVVYKNEWIECTKDTVEFFEINNTLEKLRKTLMYVDISTYHKKKVPISSFLIKAILERIYPNVTDLVEICDIQKELENELCHIKSSYHHEYLSCKYSIPVEELIEVERKIKDSISNPENVDKEVAEFEAIGNTRDKFKYLVKFTTETPGITKQQINNFLSQIPEKYERYYTILGPDRIKANGYLEADLRKEWIKTNTEVKIDEEMISKIYSTFEIGKKYGKAKIKSTLKDIYSEFKFEKTAKASDLSNYFVLRTSQLKENGSWVNGFEILGKR